MSNPDPLHGQTLEKILVFLYEKLGWENLYDEVRVNCFKFDPSIKSALAFLRKTPWARSKVERLFVKIKEEDL